MVDADSNIRKLIGPAVLVLTIAGLFAHGAPSLAEELAKEGTFEGNWEVEGTTESLEMDDGKVSVYRVEGPAKITNADTGMAREFQTRCVGVSDEETGGIGRCAWTDSDGDGLFLELSGEIVGPAGTTRDAVGIVVGGTGKYAGLAGGFEAEFLFWESALDEGKITFRNTSFKGSWRRP